MEITTRTATIDGLDQTVWSLSVDGEQVAELAAHTSGLILNVEVGAAHRGQGYARALYEHADRAHAHGLVYDVDSKEHECWRAVEGEGTLVSGITDADYCKPVPDEVVIVRRSYLDPRVWYCVAANMNADISSLLSPGRLGAVKRYAEQRFSDDEAVRWVRRDVDTWVMEFVYPAEVSKTL